VPQGYHKVRASGSSSIERNIEALVESGLGDWTLETRLRQFDVQVVFAEHVNDLRYGDRPIAGMFLQMVQNRCANFRWQPVEEEWSAHGFSPAARYKVKMSRQARFVEMMMGYSVNARLLGCWSFASKETGGRNLSGRRGPAAFVLL
jgi:hypothetical protein